MQTPAVQPSRLLPSSVVFFCTVLLTTVPALAEQSSAEQRQLETQFRETVRPFLTSFCLDCHGAESPEAMLDLQRFDSLDAVVKGHQTWQHVLERVQAAEMPPADFEPQPDRQTRQQVVDWIRRLRQFEARRSAGDPGLVLVRRLSNAEYNNTIRELTGHDLRPTATFPIDPANEAGFDNSGESLAMSPALMNKYLEAARSVSEHIVLTPTGIDFAPHAVMTNTDRDKYCVRKVVDFYLRQPTDLEDYFLALWEADRGPHALDEVADQQQLSRKYLGILEDLLQQNAAAGPIAWLQDQFRRMPADRAGAKKIAGQMRDVVKELRAKLIPPVERLAVRGVHKGAQAFVLHRNRQYAANRRRLNEHALMVEPEPPASIDTDPVAALLQVSVDADERQKQIAALKTFCEVFPDAFYISERGRDYVEESKKQQGEKGRLLSAGFHSMMGYFRDDQPLYDLMLNAQQQRELDQLWDELNLVTWAPMRQYLSFLWFERTDSGYLRDPEFDFARPENRSALSAENVHRLAELYLAKAERIGGDQPALAAIRFYFDDMNRRMRHVELMQQQSQSRHRDELLNLATQAWRRPLTAAEQQQLLKFYEVLTDDQQLSHEQAVRDTFVSILLSPHFCYRIDLQADSRAAEPLNGFELASRLSYFLWAGPPDAQLLQLAADGTLTQPAVLKQQARRMLKDARVAGMVREFGGHWLDFRQFEQHNSVDRERFPTFNDDLRTAMFEEPVRFLTDVFQQDRSVLTLLTAQHTFVNRTLAQHYGIPFPAQATSDWVRVDDVDQFDRGGLLPMSVFLTMNSPGLRTSPVKRGYWVVRQLLGERIPPPPPGVPELPADESELGDLTLTEALARHRALPACAVCHDRFDAVGVVFESFGPVGERRQVDLGDRPVNTTALFPDGIERRGLSGLREYLAQQRQADFVQQLNRKLLSYALSRSLILPDELLLEQMRTDLQNNEYRFAAAIETIVTSPQFRTKRGG